jgi:nucleoside-diphosphate-sugar epimerase
VEDYEKILVERVVMEDTDLPGTVLRLSAVYGPDDYQHRLFEYVRRMYDGRPAILLGEGMASWCWTHGYVEDVALAIALAVTDERAAGRVYNVGEADTLPWAGWVRELGRAAGWNGEVVVPENPLPKHLNWVLDTEQHWVADTARIRRELGYRGTAAREEALWRTVEWERTHPPEKVDLYSFDYAAEDAALAGLNR